MRPARLLASLAAACLLLALTAAAAQAHKVNIFAYAEAGKVHTQSYFNDGRPALGSTVEVYGPSGKLLASGTTDDAGEFSFPVPAERGDLKIVLVASMGHKAEYVMPASELPQAAASKAPAAKTAAAKPQPAAPAKETAPAKTSQVGATCPVPAVAAVSGPGLGEERLRAIVGQEVDARLAPLMKMLARQQEEERDTFLKVVAGIGYIFGLAGVAAYFASRRSRQG